MWGLEHIWWVPILPMIGAIANGLFGFLWPRCVTNLFAIGSTGLSFLIAVIAFFNLLSLPEGSRLYESVLYTWIQSGAFTAEAGIQVDPLSGTWLLIVTGIGFLIHVYSTGYMSHEEAYPRFFTYLNLFMFSMLLLVLGNNFLVMFIGWEGVGLCSYLLIGYYYETKSAPDAGKKAFVMNRIGDFAFLLAIMWIFKDTGSIDYTTVFGMAHDTWAVGGMAITMITLLLFIGATGKSAQLPLYTWLPDAMEGPTPVSALIHAATMVTAGVYMVARSATLFNMAPTTMMTVAAIGALTAIFAATMGMYQYDIKRVLAYSTVSQLGYMFLALGVGAYVAAAFHVMTHAFFKACLFLGSGSVIHGMSGEQDMRQMGGLKKLMPLTHGTFLIATIAIAGIPPLAGFFSKDEILLSAFLGPETAHKVFWGMATVAALITAFYMFRLYFMTFPGELRAEDHHVRDHVHESPPSMTGPLVVLAGLALVGGLLGLPQGLLGEHAHVLHNFLSEVPGMTLGHGEHAAHPSVALEVGLMTLSVAAGVIGILIAWYFYGAHPEKAEALSKKGGVISFVHYVLNRKYFVDEIYEVVFVMPLLWLWKTVLWKIVDVKIIDGFVNAVAAFFAGLGAGARTMQTGSTRNYALVMVTGGLLLAVIWVFSIGG
ncbi:MAG: NADH-quinone oxidoreductase subunit L [Nitrospinae bacterium]|nr:NADH-quinone oxidoreductase subunit L [Nitrospinota bacterium]